MFVSTEYIYKYTVIENNVDADLINKMIIKAQDMNIQSVLGQRLYKKLLNDCPSFSGDYLTLVKDYIQPALAEWLLYHILPFINYKLTNKAVSTKNSDNSNPSGIEDLKWLRSQIRDNAEFYSERIIDYIKDNETSFPEYFLYDDNELRPSRSVYFSGIYTRRKRYGYDYDWNSKKNGYGYGKNGDC